MSTSDVVKVAYGSSIIYMAGSNTSFTLNTSQKYMEDDVSIEVGAFPTAALISKTVAANGVYSASNDGADGYSEVTVSLPSYTGAYTFTPATSPQTIQTSGLLMSSNVTIQAYTPATLISKTITSNGTYSAVNDGADGYSKVTVSVSGGPDTSDATLSSGAQMLSGITAYASGVKYTGTIEEYAGIVNSQAGNIPYYSGAYLINPSAEDQIISTNGLVMSSDFTFKSYSGGGGGNDAEIINRTITKISNSDVVNVGPYAFAMCSLLSHVDFPNVEYVGQSAFAYCYSLSAFNLSNVISIDSFAFYECHALLSASFPRVTSIGIHAFVGCSSFSYADFPNAIEVGSYAFYRCFSLLSANFPKMEYVPSDGFMNCWALLEVSFPKAKLIDQRAFAYCSSLAEANFSSAISIFSGAFYECSSLSIISFPVVEYIGPTAFAGCGIKSVYLSLITKLENGTFARCPSLSLVDCPNVTSIQSTVFALCSGLSAISFSKLVYLGSNAFNYCANLLSLYLTGSSVCTLANSNAFTATPIAGSTASTEGVYGSIYVPQSLLTTYKAATNWSYFSSRFVGV